MREELSRTIEKSKSGPTGTDSPNRPVQLFEMDEGVSVRQQNTQYNEDIERAYAESMPAGGANAIPCATEEERFVKFYSAPGPEDYSTTNEKSSSL